MRRAILGFMAVMALSAAPALGQTPLKIGFINSQVLLDQAPGSQAASAQFEEELGQMRAQLQPMAAQFDTMVAQFESQSMTLSEEARRQRQQQILQAQAQLEQAAGQMEQQAAQRRAEIVQPIMDRVSRTIEALRVEGGYHLIFDVAAGSVIAADPALDLTQEVLRRLQATAGTTGDRDR
jgi:outer membrane protein